MLTVNGPANEFLLNIMAKKWPISLLENKPNTTFYGVKTNTALSHYHYDL
jgi:hypothetical protein